MFVQDSQRPVRLGVPGTRLVRIVSPPFFPSFPRSPAFFLPFPSRGFSVSVVATWDDIVAAEKRIRPILSPAPLIRSYALERALGLPTHRRAWIKDYGWTPVGSFKVLVRSTGPLAIFPI